MKLFLVFLALYSAVLLPAQSRTTERRAYSYTAASARFFSDEDYARFIRSAAEEFALKQGVPGAVFDERYPEYRAAIEKRAKPEIQRGFRWAEFTGESALKAAEGTDAYEKQLEVYTTQLRKAVVSVLEGYEWKGLLSFDQSDRITLFRSLVSLRDNGVLHVVEDITIYNGEGGDESLNNDIQRGILREFPTKYEDSTGFLKIVPVKILTVLRNGKPEPYTTVEVSNGFVFRIGEATYTLPTGVHTYRIVYETAEQVGFFAEHDELYWNATGNGWRLKIDSAVCEVRFPAGSRMLQQACYTGLQGTNTGNCTSRVFDSSTVVFTTTHSLEPYEGLTIGAGIAKGVMKQASPSEKLLDFLHDNLLLPIVGAMFLVLVVINSLLWRKVGRDPHKGIVHPQFEPPAKLSPAEVGYILDRKFGSHLAAASLVDAAVNKHISIEVSEGGILLKHPIYTVRPLNSSKAKKVSYHSFGTESALDSIGEIEQGKYNSYLRSFSRTVETFVEENHLVDPAGKKKKQGLFAHNAGAKGAGTALIVLTGIASIIYLGITENGAPGLLIASGVIFAAGIVLQAVFSRLMGAYTPEGRAIADKILGFKMYLETTEEHVFDALMPPEKTLELFERYLPFAIALKVENRWADKFQQILAQAAQTGYQPAYYSGNFSSHSSSTFASAFSSGISTAVSSASSPPGSSGGGSGSSGGGSSGGGGGGGGGGGW